MKDKIQGNNIQSQIGAQSIDIDLLIEELELSIEEIASIQESILSKNYNQLSSQLDNFVLKSTNNDVISQGELLKDFIIFRGNIVSIHELIDDILLKKQSLLSGLSSKLKTISSQIKEETEKTKSYINELITDSVTGLKGRKILYHDLNELEKQGLDFSIIFIDLNDLKTINDNYGHNPGDALLNRFAVDLMTICSDDGQSYAYRFGGDEFVIVSIANDESNFRLINKLKSFQKNRKFQFISNGEIIKKEISFSFGIERKGSKTINETIDIADKKMYEQKKETVKYKTI